MIGTLENCIQRIPKILYQCQYLKDFSEKSICLNKVVLTVTLNHNKCNRTSETCCIYFNKKNFHFFLN